MARWEGIGCSWRGTGCGEVHGWRNKYSLGILGGKLMDVSADAGQWEGGGGRNLGSSFLDDRFFPRT